MNNLKNTPPLSKGAQYFLIKMADIVNEHGVKRTTQPTLSVQLGFSERTIRNHLSELKRNGLCKMRTRVEGRISSYYFPTLKQTGKVANNKIRNKVSTGKVAARINSSTGKTDNYLTPNRQKNCRSEIPTPYLYNIYNNTHTTTVRESKGVCLEYDQLMQDEYNMRSRGDIKNISRSGNKHYQIDKPVINVTGDYRTSDQKEIDSFYDQLKSQYPASPEVGLGSEIRAKKALCELFKQNISNRNQIKQEILDAADRLTQHIKNAEKSKTFIRKRPYLERWIAEKMYEEVAPVEEIKYKMTNDELKAYKIKQEMEYQRRNAHWLNKDDEYAKEMIKDGPMHIASSLNRLFQNFRAA